MTMTHKINKLEKPGEQGNFQALFGRFPTFCGHFRADVVTSSGPPAYHHHSYVWKTKKETLTLVWEIIQTAPPYTNITKRCSSCLQVELPTLMYPNQSELLNKRSELVSKCRHENKFLLQTFNSND